MSDSIKRDIITAERITDAMKRGTLPKFTIDERRVIIESLESWIEILKVADNTSDEVD